MAQNSGMQFGDADKIGLCNTIAMYLGKCGLPNQHDFAKHLRGLPRAGKAMAGAQILKAYSTGRQYGLKEKFHELYPRSCGQVDTVCWGARYEIYTSMLNAFQNAENSHKFVKLLERNLASGTFRYSGEDDERARVYPGELED